MIRILLISPEKNTLSDLKTEFEKNATKITWIKSCEDVFSIIKKEKFDLIVTDEKLTDIYGIECIKKLILVNPLLNCAAVSSLSKDDFHEATEGLGILMQLPKKPDKKDAIKLLEHLNTILNCTRKVS